MYGVPDKENFKGLYGKQLIQICFGSNHVIFRFTDEVEISFEVAIKHIFPNGETYVTDECWKQGTSLTLLLGSFLNSLDSIAGKTLKLEFSNGHIIEVKDESQAYESFQIKTANGLIVI